MKKTLECSKIHFPYIGREVTLWWCTPSLLKHWEFYQVLKDEIPCAANTLWMHSILPYIRTVGCRRN